MGARRSVLGVAGRAAVLGLTASIAGCGVSGADIEVGRLQGTDPASVRALLESVVAQRGAPPSLSVAVAVDGEIVLAEAAGLADVKAEVAATPATTYRVYSISKAITAVAVLQLRDAGKLRLTDEVRAWVPAFPAKPWPITLEQLLTHTSGIRHYAENAGEISSRVEYASLAESLDVFKDDPLEFQPGTAYRYTSFGFNLLTGAIAGAARTDFGTYLERQVFAPAGMTASRLDVAGRADPARATGYSPGGRSTRLPNVSGRYGSSGVVSTPGDLVRLVLGLESHRLLAAESVQQLFTVAHPALSERQAPGWFVTTDEQGRRLVYSTGGGMGYTGLLFHYPEQRVSGALLANQAEFEQRVAVLEALLQPFLDPARPGQASGPDGAATP